MPDNLKFINNENSFVSLEISLNFAVEQENEEKYE